MTNLYKQEYISLQGEQGGPRAKKSLGQNFLQDPNIARKIVSALAITRDDAVLEIGPGPGALTGFILGCEPARLVLVEKDPHWARERMRQGRAHACRESARPGVTPDGSGAGGGFSVLLADALRMPWERFDRPWKCIGNLPYNVASPLMWDIFSRAPGLTRAVFMIQKEVGQRILASPGTAAYGALGVWVQSFMRARLECIVPPQVFRPRPKVDSAVLSFEPLARTGAGQCEPGRAGSAFSPPALSRTLRLCFQMRRKQLGTILRSGGFAADLLAPLGIDPKARPEVLTPTEFHELSAALFPGG